MSLPSVIVDGKSRVLGCLPSQPKHSAYRMARMIGAGMTPEQHGFTRAPSADIFSLFPAVRNQGSVGNCTGQGAREVSYVGRTHYGAQLPDLSAGYPYARTRKDIMRVSLAEDSGATIEDMLAALERYGVCSEAAWSSDPDNFANDPGAAQDAEAAQHKAVRVYTLDDIAWIEACLSERFAVVFGFAVSEEFYQYDWPRGIMQKPKDSDVIIGWHCVCMGGYNQASGEVDCQNSWGMNSRGGRFLMPYEQIEAGRAQGMATVHWVVS